RLAIRRAAALVGRVGAAPAAVSTGHAAVLGGARVEAVLAAVGDGAALAGTRLGGGDGFALRRAADVGLLIAADLTGAAAPAVDGVAAAVGHLAAVQPLGRARLLLGVGLACRR